MSMGVKEGWSGRMKKKFEKKKTKRTWENFK